MYCLVYMSSPTSEMGEDEVQDLLRRAQHNNESNDITGILIHDRRRYLQYLEGDEAKVEETFARISVDPRHRAIIRLHGLTISRRQFPGWAMVCQMSKAGGSLKAAVEPLVQNCDRDVADNLLKFAAARDQAASAEAARSPAQ
ncbi:BLUF domain-containing protein [Parasphingorhabdus sp.]|uniref:BLUF domain-containing protein n=1 Tax=Parasphingorhabdus sp. TaxID=2709688 RepID=UPI003001B685